MRRWLLLATVLSVQALAQQAYRWTDENGQVHYSDRPAPGATEIRLRGAQAYSSATPARGSSVTAPAGAEAQAQPAAATEAYRVFNVVQPSQQETLWNIGSVLNVQVDLQPALQTGHHLGAYLDGELVDVGATSTGFQLMDVFRGMHTLQAAVIDSSGEVVLRSSPVEFMVQQTTILNPNNPNSNPRAR